MRLDKEGAFAHTRTEFLLSGIVYLLEMLVSFKTTEEFDITKIDDILTESPPRMVKVSDEVKKQRSDSDIERKNNMNRTFMETLREVCVHSGRIKTLDDPNVDKKPASGRAETVKPDNGKTARRAGSNRARGATVRRRK